MNRNLILFVINIIVFVIVFVLLVVIGLFPQRFTIHSLMGGVIGIGLGTMIANMLKAIAKKKN